MSQTAYNQNLAIGRAGMLADNRNRVVVSAVSPSDDIAVGVAVVRGTADRDALLPTTAAGITGAFKGITIVDLSVENIRDAVTTTPPHFPAGEALPLLQKGAVYVLVEENVTPASPVYARFATGIADNTKVQKGAFRGSPDGTAQVATLTPTAVNSTQYWVDVNGVVYSYVSDSSATATEIVTGFKTAMSADPLVNATGTTTLILTAKTAGLPFNVTADPNMAIVATQANVQTAALVPAARYITTALAGAVAVLELK